MDPLRKFLCFIEDEQLFHGKDRVLLAVSGGKDSVFMTRLFAESKIHFAIAHCNFQLRGPESDRDADFVKELATSFNVPFYSINFETEAVATRNQISVQMAARDLRYAWLEETRVAHSYHYIAVAHHQTDSVETILLNMTRGTGIAGLHGILPKRGRIVRPLLAFTGKEVEDYIYSNSILYREDRSNLETKYARNKVRLEVLPALRHINPALESTFSLSSKRFHALENFLDLQIEIIRKSIFIEDQEGVYHIPIKHLLPNLLDSFVLFELFKPFSFSESVLSDLIDSLLQVNTGRIFYSENHQLLIDRDKLILRKIHVGEDDDFYIDALPAEFSWGGQRFQVYLSTDTNFSKDNREVRVDAALVSLPIRVRSWVHGDHFIPLGLHGRKKISDFLIDQKVPLDEKKKVPLFVNSNNDILWVAPFRIDERYKVSQKTKKVIIFEQL